LLVESKADGAIGHAHSNQKNTSPTTMAGLLGTETHAEAQHISSRSQRLASHTVEAVEEAIEAIKADGEEVSKAAVNRKLVGAHVGHNSGENEWYTQAIHIEAARNVLGCIDLDPASSELANKTIQAKRFYSAEDDGLSKKWKGDVWMNPPYSSNLIGLFCDKMVMHVSDGSVTSAIVLINNATETQWFHTLASQASAYCFPKGRVRFVDVNGVLGASPLQGQCFVYFGTSVAMFKKQFSEFGIVVKAY
jgi:ParB family chromosome partitioning protein